jgi:hypothetical protein
MCHSLALTHERAREQQRTEHTHTNTYTTTTRTHALARRQSHKDHTHAQKKNTNTQNAHTRARGEQERGSVHHVTNKQANSPPPSSNTTTTLRSHRTSNQEKPRASARAQFFVARTCTRFPNAAVAVAVAVPSRFGSFLPRCAVSFHCLFSRCCALVVSSVLLCVPCREWDSLCLLCLCSLCAARSHSLTTNFTRGRAAAHTTARN